MKNYLWTWCKVCSGTSLTSMMVSPAWIDIPAACMNHYKRMGKTDVIYLQVTEFELDITCSVYKFGCVLYIAHKIHFTKDQKDYQYVQHYIINCNRRKVTWLLPGSEAHKVLRETLTNPTNVKTLKMLSHGMHTGTLENLHSLILAYAHKRLDFDPPGYNARVMLAIIDHNRNIGRGVQKGKRNKHYLQH